MFREESVINQITVEENGTILVRYVKRIYKGDTLVSQTYHRESFAPGADVSKQDKKIISIADAIWKNGDKK
jgi:hypothetical protein